MKATDKSRNFSIRSNQKTMIVKELTKQFSVTEKTVYNAINGHTQSELAESIKREYSRLMKAIDSVFSKG